MFKKKTQIKRRETVLPIELHTRREMLWSRGRLQKIEAKEGGGLVVAKLIRRTIRHFNERMKRLPETAKNKRYVERISRLILNNFAMATDHGIARAKQINVAHEAWNTEFTKTMLHYWHLIPDPLKREITHQVSMHQLGKRHQD